MVLYFLHCDGAGDMEKVRASRQQIWVIVVTSRYLFKLCIFHLTAETITVV